jgi:hypothetical protein
VTLGFAFNALHLRYAWSLGWLVLSSSSRASRSPDESVEHR